MGKIDELLKEKIKIRVENPVRSSMLGMIVDNAKKLAKSQMRDVADDDITVAAKKMKNETLKAIDDYKKGNGDYSHLENEILILEEFIPKGMTEEQIFAEVDKIVSSLSVEQRLLKNVMPLLKQIPGIDMKVAKAHLDSILS